MYKDTDKQECAAKRLLKRRERAVNTAFEQLCYTFVVLVFGRLAEKRASFYLAFPLLLSAKVTIDSPFDSLMLKIGH